MSVCVCLWMDLQGCVEEVGDKRYTRQPPGSTFITGQKPDRSDIVHLMKLLSMLTKRVKGVNTETNYMTFCNLGKVEQTPWPRWKGLKKLKLFRPKCYFVWQNFISLAFYLLMTSPHPSSGVSLDSMLSCTCSCALSPLNIIYCSQEQRNVRSQEHTYMVFNWA